MCARQGCINLQTQQPWFHVTMHCIGYKIVHFKILNSGLSTFVKSDFPSCIQMINICANVISILIWPKSRWPFLLIFFASFVAQSKKASTPMKIGTDKSIVAVNAAPILDPPSQGAHTSPLRTWFGKQLRHSGPLYISAHCTSEVNAKTICRVSVYADVA